MNQDGTRKEALKAALAKVDQARVLLNEARLIFHSYDYDWMHLQAGEALDYINEMLEDY